MKNIWTEYPEINNEIEKVKTLMKTTLSTPSKSAGNVIEYLLSSEGKYLRAGLTILSAKIGEYNEEKAIKLAAAFEMLHMATLVHDDIIDDSEYRRGQKSVQAKFGKDVAVYTGDLILCKAYGLVIGEQEEYYEVLIKGIEKICLSEIMQNENRYNPQLTEKNYLKIISGKTATLFGMCVMAGAKAGGIDDKNIKKLVLAAKHMGMAYQIIDDCLDYDSNFHKLRKNPFIDVLGGVYTLPLLKAMKKERKELSLLIQNRNTNISGGKHIIDLVIKGGGVEASKDIASRYMDKSIKALNKIKTNRYVEMNKQLYLSLCKDI